MKNTLVTLLLATFMLPAAAQRGVITPPPTIAVDGAPDLPEDLASALSPYSTNRSASPVAWDAETNELIISTRGQLYSVAAPMMAPRQLSPARALRYSFRYSPKGDIAVTSRDKDGDELYQIYARQGGKLRLLTDGESANTFGAFTRDGRSIIYTSTKRNGVDNDFLIMDPRDPASARTIAEMKGGEWDFNGLRPGDTHAVVSNYTSYENRDLYDLDLATGELTPLAPPGRDILFSSPRFASDGTLWVLSDEDSDLMRLGILKDGRFTPVTPEYKWNIELYAFVPGDRIVYVVNEAGYSRLHLLDMKTRQVRSVSLPAEVLSRLTVSRSGMIAFSLSGPKLPGDVFVLDPATMAVARWTNSYGDGPDSSRNAEAQLVTVHSFDGEPVSGFLFRPDPAKFPGKRPLLIYMHGGPVAQTRPGYRGVDNYYINELGVAMFYANVRGSDGYGKRFRSLDNGPFRREDAVKDIGAFLDHFTADPAIDAGRIGVQGPSYGGYMTYATAIRYGDRLRGAYANVAVSSFIHNKTLQEWRRSRARAEYGDERDPEQRAKLLEISPLTHASRIRIPLLVIAGGNDPRVPPSHAEDMVKAVRASGGTAWHVVAADEGHGAYFAKKANRDFQQAITLHFWKQYLLQTTARSSIPTTAGKSLFYASASFPLAPRGLKGGVDSEALSRVCANYITSNMRLLRSRENEQ